jgi:hypothetical protein
MTRRLKDANDAQLLRGSWSIEFNSAKQHHINHGVMYRPFTNYGKFYWEGLVKPMGEGYVFITGRGGDHIIAIQLVNASGGGYQINGHIDNSTSGVLQTINFQSVDSVRANEWAHLAVWYDKNYVVTMINGVPCSTSAGSIDRRAETALSATAYTGGSDHNNGNFRMACQRIFETVLPFEGAYGGCQRPAILEMSGGLVYNSTTEAPAWFISDYRQGNLIDSAGGAAGRNFNGFAYQTGVLGTIYGQYSEINDGNRDLTKLPKWVIDPFVYSNTPAAPTTPPVGVLFYDSFGRADVHYGNTAAPLTLGALEVGGVSWESSGFGILNGNAFADALAFTPARFNTGRQDNDVRITRPVQFDSLVGSQFLLYLRYTDENNWVRIAVTDTGVNTCQAQQSVAGSITTLGSVTSFNSSWSTLKATVVGTALNVYEGTTLRGGPFTINSGLTGTKVGFRMTSPVVRAADFAVLAA